MGGKSSKTKQTYTPPSWVEDTSKNAMAIGNRIGRSRFQEYDKERVAGLSGNEQRGIAMAGSSSAIGKPYFDKAGEYADRSTQSWSDTDQSKFINPYIKGALDPAARELREEGARQLTGIEDRATSMDAFGGRRSALAKKDQNEVTTQGLSDLYGRGYAQAYEFGAQQFGQERARDMEAAGRFMQLGGTAIDANQTDISTLMTTGATDRNVQQMLMDFDWQQFVEERDWDFRQLMGVVSALEGTRGSYTTTTTSKTKESGTDIGTVVGAIASVVAAVYTGGASLAVAPASDERLKENIVYLFTYMGRKMYTWTWNPIAHALGLAGQLNVGVMAQENPDLSSIGPDGFLRVNYRKMFGE